MGQQRQKKKPLREKRDTKARGPVSSDSPRPRLRLHTTAGIAIAIGLLGAAIFFQTRHFGFIYLDDPVYVTENARVLQGLSWDGLLWALTTPAAGNWHPLTWLSHMADVQLFGRRPGGHHMTSVILHSFNSVLLFAAMHRMTHAPGRSAFVAGLFAIHPLHVESVVWISERKDVLSTLFWMLTIHAYISFVRKGSLPRMGLVVCLFALGLMSKPMLVTLPLTLLLLDYWPLKRVNLDSRSRAAVWVPLVTEKFLLFLLSAVSAAITFKVQRGYGAVIALQQLPLTSRVSNALAAYILYLRDFVWPENLAPFYPFRVPPSGVAMMAAIVLVGFTLIALRIARAHPYLIVGWLWYLVTLTPVIGLVQVGEQGRADRYTYAPLIGVLVMVAWGVNELTATWRNRALVLRLSAVLTIVTFSILASKQTSYWASDISLWTHATVVTTGNYRAESLLGVALSDAGRNKEAIAHYQSALSIWNGNAETHNNLGSAWLDEGKLEDALREYAEAVRLKPQSPVFHYNLAVLLNENGRREEAISHLRIAVRLDPETKQFAEALSALTKTTR